MDKPTLRETIEISLDRFKAANYVHRDDPKETLDQILQAVHEYCDELIGEDDKLSYYNGRTKRNMSKFITRRELRQELREKLKEDLEENGGILIPTPEMDRIRDELYGFPKEEEIK